MTDPYPERRYRGFQRAGVLVEKEIRAAGESRGFAVSKVLTHWAEIAGEEAANHSRPVKVSYPTSGLGATLTVLTTGAQAPFLEMQKEALRARINACYGYSAIARIQITQTAPQGFAEGRPQFRAAPAAPPRPDPLAESRARAAASGIRDDGLRTALEEMGRTLLSRPESKEMPR